MYMNSANFNCKSEKGTILSEECVDTFFTALIYIMYYVFPPFC